MKKVILSAAIMFALSASVGVMAQDKKKENPANKTECCTQKEKSDKSCCESKDKKEKSCCESTTPATKDKKKPNK